MTIAAYTVQLIKDGATGLEPLDERDKRVLADMPAYLEELEENLTDLLPEGYSVTIKEWNDE